MALKTPQEYLDSMGKIKHNAFIAGKRIDNVLEHPNTRPGLDAIAKTYELELDPRYEEIFTTTSHLTGEKISRWTHVPRSVDDLDKRRQMNILMSQKTGTCFPRCGGTDSLPVIASVIYATDQKLGTEYQQRFNNFLRYFQENDLTGNVCQADARGDRSKRLLDQEHPDFFIHAVEKRSDGIVVRGAKVGQVGQFACHEHFVMPPLLPLREGEEDYALCFVIPAGTEGLTYICQDGPIEAERRQAESIRELGIPQYGSVVTAMLVFNDVFVPWERVFLCGEREFAMEYTNKWDGLANTLCPGSCQLGFLDLMIGGAQTIVEYNGISKAAHVVDKITEMLRLRETSNACATAAVQSAKEDPPGSGVYLPDQMPSIMANLNAHQAFPQIALLAADLAGGAVVTMPSERELQNPETSQYVKKYLKGVASIPTEDRMRMLKFLQHWTAGPQAVMWWHGSVPPQAHRQVLYGLSQADLEEKKKLAKELAGIKE